VRVLRVLTGPGRWQDAAVLLVVLAVIAAGYEPGETGYWRVTLPEVAQSEQWLFAHGAAAAATFCIAHLGALLAFAAVAWCRTSRSLWITGAVVIAVHVLASGVAQPLARRNVLAIAASAPAEAWDRTGRIGERDVATDPATWTLPTLARAVLRGAPPGFDSWGGSADLEALTRRLALDHLHRLVSAIAPFLGVALAGPRRWPWWLALPAALATAVLALAPWPAMVRPASVEVDRCLRDLPFVLLAVAIVAAARWAGPGQGTPAEVAAPTVEGVRGRTGGRSAGAIGLGSVRSDVSGAGDRAGPT
jgi:hypothetical protein